MVTKKATVERRSSHMASPPEAKGLPLLGSAMSALRGPLLFLKALKEKYGDMVMVRFGLTRYYVIQSPEAFRYVLQENARNYIKPGAARMLKKFMGDGLATSNGDLWLKQRRLMQPAFHHRKIEGFAQTIKAETTRLCQAWHEQPSGHQTDISEAFQRLTLSNITKTMFGADLNQEMDHVTRIINDLEDAASKSIVSLIQVPLFVPTASNRKFLKATHEFEKIIYHLIERRKQEDHRERNDLLDLLLHAYDDQSQSYMTVRQLRDEITTIFMAGHETTAQTLSWVFYHLALHPEIYAAVKREADTLPDEEYTMESLQQLKYTRMVIEEALRLYPPVWIMVRKAIANDQICGFDVPAEAVILGNVYGMNHSPKHWVDPEVFNPSRFDDHRDTWHPFVFIPFGGGQRLCIGRAFAMMVMQTVVARLVKEFSFSIPVGFVPAIEPNATLRVKGGIRLNVIRHSKT